MADPHDPLHHLQREVERMFLDLVYQRHPSCHFTEPTWSPAADVMVSEDSARVIMELAGVPRENFRVRLQGRMLEVSGRRHSPRDPAVSHYHRAEILFGDFRRVIELPWEADEKRVDARYQNGMLEIHLFPSPTHRTTRVAIQQVESK